MSTYYFVRTPLQYINALEANLENRFESKEHHLILLSDYHKTIHQLKSIIKKQYWTSIEFIWEPFAANKNNSFMNALSIWGRKRTLDSILRQIKESDKIFWGNINSTWFFYVHHNLKNHLHLLDDGFATINHLKPFEIKPLKVNLLSSKSGKIEKLLLQPKFEINWNKITFYTNLNFMKSEKKVIEHSYLHLSKMVDNLEIRNEVYFIGQPLIFQKMMTKEYYVNRINEISDFYKSQGLTFKYLPHRSTTLDYIPKTWEIIQFDFPLEFILMQENFAPKVFATFYSSALYNLEILGQNLDIQCEYWRVEAHEISNYPYENIAYLYDLLSENPKPNRKLRLKDEKNNH
jgi:hypothetical protein